jgi:hypothetical protein
MLGQIFMACWELETKDLQLYEHVGIVARDVCCAEGQVTIGPVIEKAKIELI